jgi:hypothetical protein
MLSRPRAHLRDYTPQCCPCIQSRVQGPIVALPENARVISDTTIDSSVDVGALLVDETVTWDPVEGGTVIEDLLIVFA